MSGGVAFRRVRERETLLRMTRSPALTEPRGNYTVYFRDSDESLRCLSHRAPSESEARDWFTRIGIAVVAIRAQAQLAAV